ncbi:MAG: polyprenyl synthetase family protein [Tepidisphaeraceae bacterium]|jgi:geranylgeranyl pyrophosphate synthase
MTKSSGVICAQETPVLALEIYKLLQDTTSAVEATMDCIVAESSEEAPELYAEARASINDAGHRILSTLLRMSYEISGCSYEQVLPLCAGIEFLQVSALLVDDIFDDAITRNGRASIRSRCGDKEATAIGMVLGALGMRTIAEFLTRGAPPKEAVAILQLFAQVQQEIYTGQFLDLRYAGRPDLSEDQYFNIITRTTACFIRAPLVAGALLWGAPTELTASLDSIGLKLGVAYQVRDDVIDFLGDSDCTGKPQFGDLRQRRMRLPLVHALRQLDGHDRQWLLCLLKGQEPISDGEIERACALLTKAGSLEYAIGKTKEFCRAARNSLASIRPRWRMFAEQIDAIADLISSFD